MSWWKAVLIEPAQTVLAQIGNFATGLLLVLLIAFLGWIIANLIKLLVVKGLKLCQVDILSERITLSSILAKGGIKYSLSELIGEIIFWLGMLVTFIVALNSVGLNVAADLLNRIVLYIPSVIAAIFILILGMFVASLLSTILQTAAYNVQLSQAALIGKIVEITVMVFASLIALEQLGIPTDIFKSIINLVLGTIGVAVALAFGLGCKDIAAKTLQGWLDKTKAKR